MSSMPNYFEYRLNLRELNELFYEYVGNESQVNIGETVRGMLHDFFYGEYYQPQVPFNCIYAKHDRVLVMQPGGQPILNMDLALDSLGEIFWNLVDLITNSILRVSQGYTHKPPSCFYKYWNTTRELVVYVPVMSEYPFNLNMAQMDGRAVITACTGFLPSYLTGTLQSG